MVREAWRRVVLQLATALGVPRGAAEGPEGWAWGEVRQQGGEAVSGAWQRTLIAEAGRGSTREVPSKYFVLCSLGLIVAGRAEPSTRNNHRDRTSFIFHSRFRGQHPMTPTHCRGDIWSPGSVLGCRAYVLFSRVWYRISGLCCCSVMLSLPSPSS